MEGRVPSRPSGLRRARRVEMELDIPKVSSAAAYHTTAGETQKVQVPWRAEFHLGHWGWQRARRVVMDFVIPSPDQRCSHSGTPQRNRNGAGTTDGRVP